MYADVSSLEDVKQGCYNKLCTALDEMVDSIEKLNIKYEHELGSQEVTVWKQMITDGESEFTEFLNKNVLLGEPVYPVSMIALSQDVSYSVPYYEVPCDMPFDKVLMALRTVSYLKVEQDDLLPGSQRLVSR